MRYSLRQKRLRDQRSSFFVFVGAALVYLIAGVPLVAGSLATSPRQSPQHRLPSFAELDRNYDGYVDSSEAAGLPAYASAFGRADVNGDGRLTPAEFAAMERTP